MCETRFEDLSGDVIQQAKICLLDLIGTAAGGSTLPGPHIIRSHAARFFGAGEQASRMLFDGRPVSAPGAALAGGSMIDGLDCHDGHALTKGHVGCAILPAILAYYDAFGRDRTGQDLLTDLVIGYEIGTRMGIALHDTACDYHTSGAWNAITCAALGARIMNLDMDAARHALGIAEYHGPRSQMMRVIDHPTMLKDGSGWGAMAGVSAAYLAQDGFSGAPALLVEDRKSAPLWQELGDNWRIHEQYFKLYPVCRWAQPAIAAALSLKASHDVDGDEIEAVTIHTFHQGCRLFQGLPTDTEQAQYGISFPLAVALKYGAINAAHISGAGLTDPDVIQLCGRIRIEENGKFNDRFPAERWARAEILLKDGRMLESPDTKAAGDPDTPIADGRLALKFDELAKPVLGQARTKRLMESILTLDTPGYLIIPLLDDLLNPVD
ncbi:MmgE/PrpD family protein [Aestuariispira insulae]|uniref:MmgE/PrpD family protein n=1 Tax=Aestuariispira insulae TaxID=1461337 RepID=UPI001C3F6D80|nr:MmgE/PrpD family protein [Aestuariispira insulae]